MQLDYFFFFLKGESKMNTNIHPNNKSHANVINITTSFNLVHCKYLIISAVFYAFENFDVCYNSDNNQDQ